ncbi:MAG: DUF1592 domain-containing protein [Myxococcota bacterium]|nr:DUF1592 domain-containing protein [Myxococcota bacterium]
MIALWLTLACNHAEEPALVPLDAPRLLRRMSLDLRGTLPSVQELDAVEEDPEQLLVLRDQYLHDPLLEERLVRLFTERWHTRIESYYIFHTEFEQWADDPSKEHPFEASVGEEPMRLLAHVVAQDRPWSEVVTADYSFANETLAEIWPVAWEEGQTGWQKTTYTDQRPMAGVLSSNGLWWRYQTTLNSYSRTRSNALTRLLVCDDYSARVVDFDNLPPLSDEEALEQAVKTVPTCITCHATLDPLGATLFGFWISVQDSAFELGTYHPEREVLGRGFLEVEPAWYGQPVSGLEELGHTIAADPRFGKCAVQSMTELTLRRSVDPELDAARLEELQQVYRDEKGHMLAVLAAITETPEYQVGAFGEAATEHMRSRESVRRQLSPGQLETAVSELTGFLWTDTGFNQMDNDTWGYRTLAGGIDGQFTTTSLQSPSMTTTLVAQRLAEGAAGYLVLHGTPFEAGGLLEGTTLSERPGDAGFDAALARLMWQTRAVRPSDQDVAELGQLWLDLEHISGDPQIAWQGTLSALLRDPEFLSY